MTEAHRLHRVATLLITASHETYDHWPYVEQDDTIRSMTRTLAHLLNALVDGDPPAQSKHLDELDGLFARIPNGDTTPGAT